MLDTQRSATGRGQRVSASARTRTASGTETGLCHQRGRFGLRPDACTELVLDVVDNGVDVDAEPANADSPRPSARPSGGCSKLGADLSQRVLTEGSMSQKPSAVGISQDRLQKVILADLAGVILRGVLVSPRHRLHCRGHRLTNMVIVSRASCTPPGG